MKNLMIVVSIFISFQSYAGYNVLIDEVQEDSVTVDLRRDGVLRFSDQNGNNYFLRCESYMFHKTMVFSSFGKAIVTDGSGCRSFIEGIKGNIESGKTLNSLEVQINGENGRPNEMFFEPGFS